MEPFTKVLTQKARAVYQEALAHLRQGTLQTLQAATIAATNEMFPDPEEREAVSWAVDHLINQNRFFVVSLGPSTGFGFDDEAGAKAFAETLAETARELYLKRVGPEKAEGFHNPACESCVDSYCIHVPSVPVRIAHATYTACGILVDASAEDSWDGDWVEEATGGAL